MSDDDISDSADDHDQRSAAHPSEVERAIVGDGVPKRKPRESKAQQERGEADGFWRACLGSRIGRRELWRLIAGADGAHAFEARFMAGPAGVPDAAATFYARGEQDLGLRFYHRLLQLDPAAVATMHDEHDHRFAKPDRRKPNSARSSS